MSDSKTILEELARLIAKKCKVAKSAIKIAEIDNNRGDGPVIGADCLCIRKRLLWIAIHHENIWAWNSEWYPLWNLNDPNFFNEIVEWVKNGCFSQGELND